MALGGVTNDPQLSERVVRVLGQVSTRQTLGLELTRLESWTIYSTRCVIMWSYNCFLTAAGTNTYLVGKVPGPFILIDTGEGKPEYIPHLKDALLSMQNAIVSDILITHKHRDHHGGLASVLRALKEMHDQTHPYRGPRLHKFPLPTGQVDDHYIQGLANSLDPHLYCSPPSPTTSSPNEVPFHPLKDAQTLECAGATLVIQHTPGHTKDSVCIHLPEENALFTADSVLGHGTAVFEDLSTYLSSLRALLSNDAQPTQLQRIYPGHGPVLDGEEATLTIQNYIDHRLEREGQLITLMRSRAASEKGWTVKEIVDVVYPEDVRQMAQRGVLLHLDKLWRDGRVSRKEEDNKIEWHIIN